MSAVVEINKIKNNLFRLISLFSIVLHTLFYGPEFSDCDLVADDSKSSLLLSFLKIVATTDGDLGEKSFWLLLQHFKPEGEKIVNRPEFVIYKSPTVSHLKVTN